MNSSIMCHSYVGLSELKVFYVNGDSGSPLVKQVVELLTSRICSFEKENNQKSHQKSHL